jgi:hypothetical protein
VAQVVEHLPTKHEALSSNHNTTQKKLKKKPTTMNSFVAKLIPSPWKPFLLGCPGNGTLHSQIFHSGGAPCRPSGIH